MLKTAWTVILKVNLLDLGCGPGLLLDHIHKTGASHQIDYMVLIYLLKWYMKLENIGLTMSFNV